MRLFYKASLLGSVRHAEAASPLRGELELIEEALQGGVQAQAQLRDRVEPVIRARARAFAARRIARRIGVDDAEDLTQRVWLELWREDGRLLRAYDPQRGMNLAGYVGLITQRELWRAAEQQAAQKRSREHEESFGNEEPQSLDAASNCPESILGTQELLRGVDEYVRSRLSPRAQLAYTLLYAEGLEVREVVGRLEVDPQTVYNWQHEIRRLARQYVEAQ